MADPFALDNNDVFFLLSCVNSYVGNNVTISDYIKYHLCPYRQVRTDPKNGIKLYLKIIFEIHLHHTFDLSGLLWTEYLTCCTKW